jgi:hypothetical protein
MTNFTERLPVLRRGLNKTTEKRMAVHWTRFEFRVKLTAEEPGVIT